jgi:uncharacterized membrane protein YhiD involved in acid resistance
LQVRPLRTRIIQAFYPTAIAGSLIFVLGGLMLRDRQSAFAVQERIENAQVYASVTNEELMEWQAKERRLIHYRALRDQSLQIPMEEWIAALAPCLPINTRIETFSLNDDKSFTLRGVMIDNDETYRMLAAIKRIPGITQVSLESVNAVGDTKSNQLQFDVRCAVDTQQFQNRGEIL